jgi:hypothetical protein
LRFTKMQKAGHKNADPQTLTWWEWSKWWENIYGELHGGHEIANLQDRHPLEPVSYTSRPPENSPHYVIGLV